MRRSDLLELTSLHVSPQQESATAHHDCPVPPSTGTPHAPGARTATTALGEPASRLAGCLPSYRQALALLCPLALWLRLALWLSGWPVYAGYHRGRRVYGWTVIIAASLPAAMKSKPRVSNDGWWSRISFSSIMAASASTFASTASTFTANAAASALVVLHGTIAADVSSVLLLVTFLATSDRVYTSLSLHCDCGLSKNI